VCVCVCVWWWWWWWKELCFCMMSHRACATRAHQQTHTHTHTHTTADSRVQSWIVQHTTHQTGSSHGVQQAQGGDHAHSQIGGGKATGTVCARTFGHIVGSAVGGCTAPHHSLRWMKAKKKKKSTSDSDASDGRKGTDARGYRTCVCKRFKPNKGDRRALCGRH
jgi:hypothetical protein